MVAHSGASGQGFTHLRRALSRDEPHASGPFVTPNSTVKAVQISFFGHGALRLYGTDYSVVRRNKGCNILIKPQVFEILDRAERRSGPREAPEYLGLLGDLDVLPGALGFGNDPLGFDIMVAPLPVARILEKRSMPDPTGSRFRSVRKGLSVGSALTNVNVHGPPQIGVVIGRVITATEKLLFTRLTITGSGVRWLPDKTELTIATCV